LIWQRQIVQQRYDACHYTDECAQLRRQHDKFGIKLCLCPNPNPEETS
jgi:hypothetical protein